MADKRKEAEDELKTGDQKAQKGDNASKDKKYLRETVEAVVIALVLAIIIRTFFVQAFKIPSGSMEDTLLIGDHLLVSKSSYGFQMPKPAMIKILGVTIPFFETELKPVWGEIERGDVVVFRFPEDRDKDFIKRVVAVGGDRVEVKDKKVYVNDQLAEDAHAVFKGGIGIPGQKGDNFGPYVVPRGKIFVMGDNRDRSFDSRFWGTVDIKEIKGRAFIIYWSRDLAQKWPWGIRFDRFAKKIR